MPLSSDVIGLVFNVSGVAAVVGALNNVASAQDRVTQAAAAYARTGTASSLLSLQMAQRQLAITSFQSSVVGAQQAFSALGHLISGVRSAIDAYADFGRKVREVMQVTGSNAQEAAYAVNLGRAAGIPDAKEIQELLKLSKSFNLMGGSNAKQADVLARLGVPIGTAHGTGVQAFNEVLDRLSATRDGLQKTADMETLFGQRGTVAANDLLALSSKQRAEVLELSNAFGGQGVQQVQRFQVSMAILGMTMEQRIIYPLAGQMLPIFQTVIGWVGKATSAFVQFNEATHGVGNIVVVFGLAATAIGLFAIGAVRVISAVRELIVVLRGLAVVQAFLTALQGPKGIAIVAGAVAIAGISAVAIGRLSSSAASATQQNTSALQQNTSALNSVLNGLQTFGGLPKGLRDRDIWAIAQRNNALGAIG